MESTTRRVNKYLSDSGACSRREADDMIAAGRVTINGQVAQTGAVVAVGDRVCLDGKEVGAARKTARPVYIALHKPAGVVCTTDQTVEGNIVDFVDHPERIFPIGRLDKESEGLILLTNDGDIVNKVLRVENAHEKEYMVAVDRSLSADAIDRMSRGIRLMPEGWTRPCRIKKLGPKVFSIVLTQGLNRQIRRMCEACGLRVVALARVRFMHIQLGPLAKGRWRNLTEREVSGLLAPPSSPPPSARANARDPLRQPERPHNRLHGAEGRGGPSAQAQTGASRNAQEPGHKGRGRPPLSPRDAGPGRKGKGGGPPGRGPTSSTTRQPHARKGRGPGKRR